MLAVSWTMKVFAALKPMRILILAALNRSCPEVMAMAFKPFFKTKNGGKPRGLGLAIIKDIVEKEQRGWVNVKSGPGKGTVFTVGCRRNFRNVSFY